MVNDTRDVYKITVEAEGQKLCLEVPSESTLEDWRTHFQTIMTFLTFVPEQLLEMFPEEEYSNKGGNDEEPEADTEDTKEN